MQIINTSYGYDKLSLKIGLKDIIVCMCPIPHTKRTFHFEYENCSNGKIKGISLSLERGIHIPYLFNEEGCYYFNIYMQSETNKSQYVSYIQPKSIKIQFENRMLRFVESPILIKNSSIVTIVR